MFTYGEQVDAVATEEGVTRKLLSQGGSLMMTEVTFRKDAVGSIHSHPHEQISYIIQGSFEFNLGGEIQQVAKGDSIYIPSDMLHGVRALEEDSIILDVFTPQREDFLK
ncbi:quercetin dioxygenase-like cupin family protein [Bacillus sp. SLBN-46]|uniref:cupin domain-containing protein n=1 Tax=Bacillus sp. SLBN-46 TaxID=3042283 RepID=UPI002859BE32|nr:cupin domain-containing protein [Bacillus sp. SLBN-46]MDR6121474.1 quercetin dioxygenase-like cupin family protein [Bacillus sp. SLBN-46]